MMEYRLKKNEDIINTSSFMFLTCVHDLTETIQNKEFGETISLSFLNKNILEWVSNVRLFSAYNHDVC